LQVAQPSIRLINGRPLNHACCPQHHVPQFRQRHGVQRPVARQVPRRDRAPPVLLSRKSRKAEPTLGREGKPALCVVKVSKRGGRPGLTRVADTPAGAEEPQAIRYLCFGTHAAPAACAEKHITAWLMRVIYLPHERLGRHVSGADFHSVDAHRRRLGNSTCRWKRAVLLAQASRGSSPCQWRCQPLVVPAAGAELTLGRRRAL
jgi:hypothetical protein